MFSTWFFAGRPVSVVSPDDDFTWLFGAGYTIGFTRPARSAWA